MTATLQQRPMAHEDAGSWADLLAAVEAADRRGEHYDAEDCAEELADPEIDLSRDSLLVLDGDVAVAYQVLRVTTGGEGPPRVLTDAAVHPAYRRRGIGTALVGAAARRAAEVGAELHLRVAEDVPGAVALAERSGLTAVRWWSEMQRDLDAPVAPALLPAGLTLEPLGPGFDAPRWDEPLRAAHNAAFAGHFAWSPDTAQAWVHWRTGSRAFRPECSAAVCRVDGAIVGYLLGFEYEADTARTGLRDLYVGAVGALPGWRGRGLGSALLAHALQRAQALGYHTASLYVDAQNPTGAVGVYSRAGFVVRRREITYALPAPSAQGEPR